MNGLKRLNLLVGLVLMILLLVAWFYLQGLVKQQAVQSETPIVLTSDGVCDLNKQGCVARLGDKAVVLHFKQPATYLTRFEMEAVISGFDSQQIEKMLVDFSMPGMQMGINRFALTRVKDQDHWQGVAMLPVCISGRKDWLVSLYFVTKQASYTAIFSLLVEN